MNLELSIFQKMVLIRTAEQLAAKYYLENRVFSFVHFSVGQELGAAVLGGLVGVSDIFIGNHRSHGHFLAKGGDLRSMFAEMLGKATGCAKGRGGSMHMYAPEQGFVGTSPILSSALPISLGFARTEKEKNLGNIVVVFVGDGATEEGNFYETLNLASLWGLPLLIVVEDNQYAVNSSTNERRPPGFSFGALADSLQVSSFELNPRLSLGETIDVTSRAISTCRLGQPVVIHNICYRYMAHSAPLFDDDAAYRIENIREIRENADPISLARHEIISREMASLDILQEMEDLIVTEVRLALSQALEDPEPSPNDLFLGVYSA